MCPPKLVTLALTPTSVGARGHTTAGMSLCPQRSCSPHPGLQTAPPGWG